MLDGLFDIDNRPDYLTENGDMLPNLKELVPREKFRGDLEVIYDHERKSNAGRRPLCGDDVQDPDPAVAVQSER